MLGIDRKTLIKAFFNNLDENIDLNYETMAVLHVNSPFQSVCVCVCVCVWFKGEKLFSEFIKSKEIFVEPAEISLGWDNVTQKFDSILFVPII